MCARGAGADHSHLRIAGDRRCAPQVSLRRRADEIVPDANLTQPGCNWEAIPGSAGAAAVRARPEQRDLAPGERVAAARLDPRGEVAEHVVVHVTDRAAALAHQVVMG